MNLSRMVRQVSDDLDLYSGKKTEKVAEEIQKDQGFVANKSEEEIVNEFIFEQPGEFQLPDESDFEPTKANVDKIE